ERVPPEHEVAGSNPAGRTEESRPADRLPWFVCVGGRIHPRRRRALVRRPARVPAKDTIKVFHQGLAWVAQLAMFPVLGLLVFPSQLDDVAVKGTALALILMFVARPLATAAATAPWRYSAGERALLGWAGLRGAVPVVLATFPV